MKQGCLSKKRITDEKKAIRKQKHEELLREQARQKEAKNRRKQEMKIKRLQEQEDRQARTLRRLTLTIDAKALLQTVEEKFATNGKIESVTVKKPKVINDPNWQLQVTFEKSEVFNKVREKNVLHVPTTLIVEASPVPEFSFYFPYQWNDSQSAFRPTGTQWETLKTELIRLFQSKVPGIRVHVITYKFGFVVVSLENAQSRNTLVKLLVEQKPIVLGKPIHPLALNIPKKKRNRITPETLKKR